VQAGHFNDFLFVSLLRGAILAAQGPLDPKDWARRISELV